MSIAVQTRMLAAACIVVAVVAAVLAQDAGFTPLFNGKDLSGWVYGTRRGAPNKTG